MYIPTTATPDCNIFKDPDLNLLKTGSVELKAKIMGSVMDEEPQPYNQKLQKWVSQQFLDPRTTYNLNAPLISVTASNQRGVVMSGTLELPTSIYEFKSFLESLIATSAATHITILYDESGICKFLSNSDWFVHIIRLYRIMLVKPH